MSHQDGFLGTFLSFTGSVGMVKNGKGSGGEGGLVSHEPVEEDVFVSLDTFYI